MVQLIGDYVFSQEYMDKLRNDKNKARHEWRYILKEGDDWDGSHIIAPTDSVDRLIRMFPNAFSEFVQMAVEDRDVEDIIQYAVGGIWDELEDALDTREDVSEDAHIAEDGAWRVCSSNPEDCDEAIEDQREYEREQDDISRSWFNRNW